MSWPEATFAIVFAICATIMFVAMVRSRDR